MIGPSRLMSMPKAADDRAGRPGATAYLSNLQPGAHLNRQTVSCLRLALNHYISCQCLEPDTVFFDDSDRDVTSLACLDVGHRAGFSGMHASHDFAPRAVGEVARSFCGHGEPPGKSRAARRPQPTLEPIIGNAPAIARQVFE